MLVTLPELLFPPLFFRNPLSTGDDITALKNKISNIISIKMGKIPTLEDLRMEQGVTLVGVGFSLDRQEVEYIHAGMYPDMSILDLICISLATPGIFKPYKWGDSFWIDGSMIEPFPMNSIELEQGKILGITTLKTKILRPQAAVVDPINQIKNIMRCVSEALRCKDHDLEYGDNVVMVSIDMEKDIINNVKLPVSLKFNMDNDITIKLKKGWDAFEQLHTSPELEEEASAQE